MAKFKIRQKVTIDGKHFIDGKPRNAIIAAVHTRIVNDSLFTLGLVHFWKTATEITNYQIAREVDAYGDKVRVIFDDVYYEEELSPGWLAEQSNG